MKTETIRIRKEDLPKARIPLPEKTGGYHRPDKGKGAYRRKPKHRREDRT